MDSRPKGTGSQAHTRPPESPVCRPTRVSRAELTAALPHSLAHGRLSQGSGWGSVDYRVAFVTTVTIQTSLASK